MPFRHMLLIDECPWLQINERAVRATGVSGISGDAVLVESAEYGPLQLARLLPGAPAGATTTPPPGTAIDGGSWTYERAMDDREKLANSIDCAHVECSHKRGLSERSRTTPVLEISREESPESGAHSHPGKRLRGSQCERDTSVELEQRQAQDSSDDRAGSACELSASVDKRPALKSPGDSSGVARVSLSQTTKFVNTISTEVLDQCSQPVHSIESDCLDHASQPPGTPSIISHSAEAQSQNPDSACSHQADAAFSNHTSAEHPHPPSTPIEHMSPVHNSCCKSSSDFVKPSCKVEVMGSAFAQGRSLDCFSIGELQMVFSFLGFSNLSAASAVCKLWRTSIAEDEVSSCHSGS